MTTTQKVTSPSSTSLKVTSSAFVTTPLVRVTEETSTVTTVSPTISTKGMQGKMFLEFFFVNCLRSKSCCLNCFYSIIVNKNAKVYSQSHSLGRGFTQARGIALGDVKSYVRIFLLLLLLYGLFSLIRLTQTEIWLYMHMVVTLKGVPNSNLPVGTRPI